MAIDTGDHVHHAPTGEDWVVAFVDGEHLYWCGWPEGRANLADCTLIKKATPAARHGLLLDMAKSDGISYLTYHADERYGEIGGAA